MYTSALPVAYPAMKKFSRRYLSEKATLDQADLVELWRCRRAHNRFGFAYQVGFVRLLNRFPVQRPFEIIDDLIHFMTVQLELDAR